MKPRRPSPAFLIACLALFVALGGVSYGFATGEIDSRELRDNTIRTRDLRNNDIRGKDVRNSSILGRDVARNTLGGTDINESRLATVPDAAKLGGVASSSYLRGDTAGFAALTLGTGSTADPLNAPPAYDVDPLGYVHLRGSMLTTGSPALTLPAGARPATVSHFLVSDNAAGSERVDINTNGELTATGDPVSLDGITFKAAP